MIFVISSTPCGHAVPYRLIWNSFLFPPISLTAQLLARTLAESVF